MGKKLTMSSGNGAVIQWLKEIGDDIPIANEVTNLIENPVQPRKKTMIQKVFHIVSKKETTTRDLAQQAQSLNELKKIIENFEGCELSKLAKNVVFGDGNPQSKIMLIGEAPGAEEDIQGLPFVGASGKLLDQMLKFIGLDRTKFYITNIIPWRPPGNRNPTSEEIAMCLPFVERRIELIQPKIIVMVGGVSAKSLLNTSTGITRIRGNWHQYQTPNQDKPIEAFAIYHPSYLLRSPGQKRVVWHDLLLLKKKLEEYGF